MHGRQAERIVHRAPLKDTVHGMCECGCGIGDLRNAPSPQRKFLSRKEKVEMLEEHRESLKSELARLEEELKRARDREP
jgi:hypothetical protein